MFLFIMGGTASGKSEYAEEQAEKIAAAEAAARGDKQAVIIYAATMSDNGPDAIERIKRHRCRRESNAVNLKNIDIVYETFECFSIEDAERLAEYAKGHVVLFDCLSGFAANVMFGRTDDASGDTNRRPRPTKEQVAAALQQTAAALSRRCSSLIIVTDQIFSDGCSYDKDVLDYIDALAAVCRTIAAAADTAAEIVYGIPIKLK